MLRRFYSQLTLLLRTKGTHTCIAFERIRVLNLCVLKDKRVARPSFIQNFYNFCLNQLMWHAVSCYVPGLKKLFT